MELIQQAATCSEVTKTEYPKIVDYLSQIYNFDFNPKENFKKP